MTDKQTTPKSDELTDDDLRNKLFPFGNAAQIVGAKRIDLFDVVRSLITKHREQARQELLDELEQLNHDEPLDYTVAIGKFIKDNRKERNCYEYTTITG